MAADAKFGQGYLLGRLRSYRRRLLTATHVRGAILLAIRCGVPGSDIAAMLEEFGLFWDPLTSAVSEIQQLLT